MKDLAALLRLLTPKALPKDTPEWSSEATNPTQFQEEMKMYSYHIPPNFPRKAFGGNIPAQVQEKLELVRLNCKLALWVEKKKFDKLTAHDMELYIIPLFLSLSFSFSYSLSLTFFSFSFSLSLFLFLSLFLSQKSNNFLFL